MKDGEYMTYEGILQAIEGREAEEDANIVLGHRSLVREVCGLLMGKGLTYRAAQMVLDFAKIELGNTKI